MAHAARMPDSFRSAYSLDLAAAPSGCRDVIRGALGFLLVAGFCFRPNAALSLCRAAFLCGKRNVLSACRLTAYPLIVGCVTEGADG